MGSDGRRQYGVVTLAVLGLSAVAAASWTVAAHGAPGSPGGPRLGWPVLASMFAVAEMFVLHVRVRREAHTVSLSEVPFVLGLVFATPADFIVGRVLGPLAVFLLWRRQIHYKALFNVTLAAAGGAAGSAIWHVVRAGVDFPGPRALLALYLAVVVAGVVDAGSLQLVIGLFERFFRPREVLVQVLRYPPLAALIATFAVVASYALQRDGRSGWFLAVCAGVLVVAYRAYAGLQERHLGLGRLYQFSRAVSASPEADHVLRQVLEQVKGIARADHAELDFMPAQGGTTVARVALDARDRLVRDEVPAEQLPAVVRATVVENGQPLLYRRGDRDPAVRALLDDRGFREALLTPLTGDAGVLGVLTVADRVGEVRSFVADDPLLLQTVAAHAAIALQNGRLIDQLRHEALHDGLTGLPNRVAFQRSAEDALAAAGPSGRRVAVMIMDLDGFKDVNDSLGHEQGDVLLVEVAARLAAASGETAAVARLGGDEFAVLVPDAHGAGYAAAIAARILAALEQPISLDRLDVAVGGSLGVALFPDDARDVRGLLKCADVAMYNAKAAAGGVCLFEAADDTADPRRLELAGELRGALARRELTVFLQPKAAIATGRLDGVEALVRWVHPRHGVVGPDDFVPLAERSGLIRELTRLVLDQALEAAAQWAATHPGLSVSVNLSPRNLLDPDLLTDVRSRLRRHGVPPHLVTFEITEGSVMSDPSRTIAVLHALRALGVRLSVDDFGTGYSSLSYLKRLPVNEVKIDKSFVVTMDHDPDNASIVRSIVDLGRNLGLRVVAEGVESVAVWRRLGELGCHVAQGYLVSHPMPAGSFAAWLRTYEPRAPGAVPIPRVAPAR